MLEARRLCYCAGYEDAFLDTLGRRPKVWVHFQQVPLSRLWVFLLAVFILFTSIGFYVDLMHNGRLRYLVVLANAIYGGLDSVVWILVLARMTLDCVLLLGVVQLLSGWTK